MNFTVTYPQPGTSGDWLPTVIPVVLLIWTAVWLCNLAIVLKRQDYDAVTRLTWVLVLLLVPFFGVLLYWTLAPDTRRRVVDPSNPLAGTPWEQNPDHVAKND